jgi:HD-GYP domain-containing protein (c-di-GMP phosphodiesterase class II)
MASTTAANALSELDAQLEAAFGKKFQLTRIPDRGSPTLRLGNQVSRNEPSVARAIRLFRRGEQVRLWMRLEAPAGQTVVASASFPRRRAGEVRRAARLFLKQWQLQERVGEYEQFFHDCAAQMGRQLEEFALLHKLAEQLNQTDLTQTPWSLAELVLPIVADVLRTEAIVLLPNTAIHNPCLICASEPTIVVGDAKLGNEEECRALVAMCAAEHRHTPSVRNWSADQTGFSPRVRNLVMTGLFTGDTPLGWLLAINRRREAAEGSASATDFGSVEAQLLNSIAAMLASHARNVGLFREREELLVAVVRALVSAVDAKDAYTCGHSERVALVARRLAQECQLSEEDCERVYLTGLLHDVGKIGVSDAVLSKPGKLTPAEFDEIKKHTELGWSILCELEQLRYVLPGVLHHHETFHGQGYPDALAGDEIPLVARILAVADAFDAMASDRPYRSGMELSKVTGILRAGAGSQWDPWVVDRFFAAFTEIEAIWKAHVPRPALKNRRLRDRPVNAQRLPADAREDQDPIVAELSCQV